MLTRRETLCLEHTPRNNHAMEEQTRLKAPELEPNRNFVPANRRFFEPTVAAHVRIPTAQ